MSASNEAHLDANIERLQQEPNLHLIIDLEDSLTIKGDLDRTLKLKELGRNYLIARKKLYQNHGQRVYIRINDLSSPFYPEDEIFLKKIKGSIQGVVLPKSEQAEQIEFIKKLGFKVMPLIETPIGLKNIRQIVKSSDHFFRFGPQDYFKRDHSSLKFPIPLGPLESVEFNRIVWQLIKISISYKKTLLTPVYGNLKDTKGYLDTQKYIIQQFPKHSEIGITALNKVQYSEASRFEGSIWHPIETHFVSYTDLGAFELAILIIADYEKIIASETILNCVKALSNSGKGFYVTPHQYDLALEFLNQLKQKNPARHEFLRLHFQKKLPEIYEKLKKILWDY